MGSMNVLVFGLGLNGGGYAAASYIVGCGSKVRVTDRNDTQLLQDQAEKLRAMGCECILGKQCEEDTLWADVVVKSPAVKPDEPLLFHAKRITSDIADLLSSPLLRKTRIVAVTGTKGKTTTATSIAYALGKQGLKCELCGNMGISGYTVLEKLEKGKNVDYLVLELSSWQIRDAYAALQGHFPPIDLAILTCFYPDHQNSYATVDDYLGDKLKLFGPWVKRILTIRLLSPLFPNAIMVEDFPCSLPSDLKVAHAALCALGRRPSALSSFPGVPHRRELVGMEGNVRYYNDSTATIAEAVAYSCSFFKGERIHLIAGGTDKGLEAVAMADVANRVASLTLLSGSFTQEKLLPLLKREYSGPFDSMENAVEEARRHALSDGGIVLLSPGAASFGLFRNEFDRGDAFRRCVISHISCPRLS